MITEHINDNSFQHRISKVGIVVAICALGDPFNRIEIIADCVFLW